MKYIPYVNIKMGTKSTMRFSTGNSLPLVQLPFAMASFSPQTERVGERERWFFHPEIPAIEGIRLTHQPSPWIGDYGTFLMSPQNDIISDTTDNAWGGYKINDAVFRPDYLKILMLKPNCTFELTPNMYGGNIRLNFHDERQSYLSFLPIDGSYTYELDKEKNILYGTSDHHSQDESVGFKMYFVVKFPEGVIDFEKSYKCENGIHVAVKKQCFEAELAISYISFEMAENALKGKCFEEAKQGAEDCWEEALSRIEIETEDEEQARTFYSCMYRVMLFPHRAYEIKKNGESVHYSPFDGKIRSGVRYTDTGFWDNARSQFPLFSMIARDEFKEMLEGFVNDYLECGYLPRWLSLGEVGCMPSTLIDGVIAEASIQNIVSNDVLENALKGMLHHSNKESKKPRYGRNGAEAYVKYGYVPANLHKESVNLTLDAAYGDWCIAQVAKKLGKDDIYYEYMKRSKNYKNLFDKETGFMRGRMENGEFTPDFDRFKWGGDYTEGSAYQNSFFVPHDMEGFCELYGGKDNFIKKLDELFATVPYYKVHGYGGEIHEMTEMAQVDFYQCAISNQPSFHIPFLYGAVGETDKTEYWVSRICKELFSYKTEKGFPGDEDNGSMSSWYIMSTLGKYSLCPGSGKYVEFAPLVKSYKIRGEEC